MGGLGANIPVPHRMIGLGVQRMGKGKRGICFAGHPGAAGAVGKVVSVEPDGSCTVEWPDPTPIASPSPRLLLNGFGVSFDDLKVDFSGWLKPPPRPLGATSGSSRRPAARRDGNGSLLCGSCGQPYPYAEPASDGGFTCRSCKSYGEM